MLSCWLMPPPAPQRHKFQLVYAVGSPAALPNLAERVAAAGALLDVLVRCPRVTAILSDSRVAVLESGLPPGGFYSSLRLLPGAPYDGAAAALRRAVADAVIAHPPHELAWLQRFDGGSARGHNALAAFMTDASRDADSIIPPSAFVSHLPTHREALLVLRGLLAHDVAAHCLTLRHRVEYGVAPAGRKRVAVPYRACDVPAERSEFAHADKTLLLTLLSYSYNGAALVRCREATCGTASLTDTACCISPAPGLRPEEVAKAMDTLLTLGPTAQQERYAEWFAASAPGLGRDEAKSIDAVAKIDPENAAQRSLLARIYRHCRPVVDFFVLYCVLPQETVQYPQRLACTASHLAPSRLGTSAGFSGTNDAHRLLPLFARQTALPDAALAATNGSMLTTLVSHAVYEPLPASGEQADAPLWRSLLSFAVRPGAIALVDAGALLAGVAPSAVADAVLVLLQQRGSPLRAVVFYDAGGWVARDGRGRQWPLRMSPIPEREAFVLFDEALCRGADMKLGQGEAIVTLGPRMGKDKLMQAAGRMRRLGEGQTLRLTAQPDVHASILAGAPAGAHTACV